MITELRINDRRVKLVAKTYDEIDIGDRCVVSEPCCDRPVGTLGTVTLKCRGWRQFESRQIRIRFEGHREAFVDWPTTDILFPEEHDRAE